MVHQKDFHVAIVGGGMCGLACAVYLGHAGIKVELFESAPKFGKVGAGVSLGPNALRALDEMGLTEAMMAQQIKKSLTKDPFASSLDYLVTNIFLMSVPTRRLYEAPSEDVGLRIHRAALLHALVELIDPAVTHFNKRCTSVSRNGFRHVVHFKDGTTFEADVVLGADGIRSTVRQAVTGDPEGKKHVAFTRTVAYRALLLWEDVQRAEVTMKLTERPHCITGVNKHIITFPIKDGKMINVVVFCTDHSVPAGAVEIPAHQWVTPVVEQDILDAHQDSGVQVQRLLSLIQNPSRWLIHAVDPPLGSFVKGNVALVGDAAHGMCPHLGAGVGQGFEDALVLCKLLMHPETELANLQDVLRIYDRVRRPRANMVLERSAVTGEIYESLCNGDNSAIIRNLRVQLSRQWDIVHHHDLGVELESAVEMLRNDGTFR